MTTISKIEFDIGMIVLAKNSRNTVALTEGMG